MVPIYCFRRLSRKSRYKTERQEDAVIHDEQGERLIASAKEQDIAQFSTPVSPLCDAFCAVVWLVSCIQYLLFVSGLGESVSGALKNPWRDKANGVGKLLGTSEAFSLSLRLYNSYLNQEELPASIACSVVATSPAVSKLEIFFLLIIIIMKMWIIIIIMKKNFFWEKTK